MEHLANFTPWLCPELITSKILCLKLNYYYADNFFNVDTQCILYMSISYCLKTNFIDYKRHFTVLPYYVNIYNVKIHNIMYNVND